MTSPSFVRRHLADAGWLKAFDARCTAEHLPFTRTNGGGAPTVPSIAARPLDSVSIYGEAPIDDEGTVAYRARDATATFDGVDCDGRLWSAEDVHARSLANLYGEYAEIVRTADLVEAVVR